MTTIIVATHNVGRPGPQASLGKSADLGAVVIGVQEMADWQSAAPPAGFDWWRPLPQSKYPNGAENPIAYRKDIQILSKGSRSVHDSVSPDRVPEGAAGKGIHAKRANWILFKWQGEKFYFSNNHTVPSLRYDIMAGLHERQMNVIKSQTRWRKIRNNVIIVGDLNAEVNHRNFKLLSDAGLRSNWQVPSAPQGSSFPKHNSRIDHVLFLPQQLRADEQSLVETKSDHNGVLVKLTTRS